MADKVKFEDIVATLAEEYPKRNIELDTRFGDCIVKVDGEEKFNAAGFRLLYNIKRLVECLENELR